VESAALSTSEGGTGLILTFWELRMHPQSDPFIALPQLLLTLWVMGLGMSFVIGNGWRGAKWYLNRSRRGVAWGIEAIGRLALFLARGLASFIRR